MKRLATLLLSLFIIFCFVGCSPKQEQEPQNPITSINIDISDFALIVGEKQKINVSVLPLDTDETATYVFSDPSVISYIDGEIIAKKQGETSFTVKSNKVVKTIYIRVCSNMSYSEFKETNQMKLQRSTLKVFNKNYNTNVFGAETTSKIIEGRATIVKFTGTAYTFITYKPLFNLVDGYKYQKWYVEDYAGNKYDLTDIRSDDNTDIAFSSFISSNILAVLNIFDGTVYKGEQTYSIIGNPLSSRVDIADYNYFYHQTNLSTGYLGASVVNSNCEVLGIAVTYNVNSVKSVAARSIIKHLG